jgi:MFS family permease
MAIGCMASPLVGMLADRFWPAQKVLAGLNFVHAFMLLWAGTTNNPDVLFISLLLAMLAYMPSWSLTSAIAMAHLPSELSFTLLNSMNKSGCSPPMASASL